VAFFRVVLRAAFFLVVLRVAFFRLTFFFDARFLALFFAMARDLLVQSSEL
jgi:hypothetical protein